MNPNIFIFSTDFMTLAKNNSVRRTIVIPSSEITDDSITADGAVDIPVNTAKGAIVMMAARYSVNDEYGPWAVIANALTFEDNGPDGLYWRIRFKRINDTTIRMYWVCLSRAYHHGIVTPTIVFELFISTFYPPNV